MAKKAEVPQTPQSIQEETGEGLVVVFTGFTEGEDVPENGELLVVGQEYQVTEVLDGDDDTQFYIIDVDNPKFNAKKKESESNQKRFAVEVLSTEAEIVSAEEGAGDNSYPTITVEDMVIGQVIWGLDAEGEFQGDVVQVAKDRSSFRISDKDNAIIEITMAGVNDLRLVKDAERKASASVAPVASTGKKANTKDAAPTVQPTEKVKPTGKPVKETQKKAEVVPITKTTSKAKTVAPVKEQKPDEDQDMIILEPDQEDQEIVSLVAGAEDLFELVRDIVAQDNRNQYTLGGILYHIRVEKSYKELSPDYAKPGGFQLFVQEQLGVGYRKAMNLIDIYTKFNINGIGSDVVESVGWSKSALIARYVDEENKEELVEMAQNLSAQELSSQVKERYAAVGDDERPRTKFVTFKFRLVEDLADQVKTILEQAGAATNQSKLEQVFASIVTEWGLEHLHVEDAKSTSRVPSRSSKKEATDQGVVEEKKASTRTRANKA